MAAEVIDSRFADYRFALPDVVADNTSAAGVLVGEPVPLAAVTDLASSRCEVEVDGEVVHRATGAAVLGDPLRAVQLLSEHLASRRAVLPAGSLVLAGVPHRRRAAPARPSIPPHGRGTRPHRRDHVACARMNAPSSRSRVELGV